MNPRGFLKMMAFALAIATLGSAAGAFYCASEQDSGSSVCYEVAESVSWFGRLAVARLYDNGGKLFYSTNRTRN